MGKLDSLRKAKNIVEEQIKELAPGVNNVAISGSGEEYKVEKRTINVDNIDLHESNVYNTVETGDDDIERLAEDIRLNGLMHNLVVTQRPAQKHFVLLSGERRLRAIRLLREKMLAEDDINGAANYSSVSCNLIKIDAKDSAERLKKEEIYLDAANLQARGTIGDVNVMQTVTVRYIKNMMDVYALSEIQAKRLLKDVTGGKNDRTIERNFAFYKALIPEMYDFFVSEENQIDKNSFTKIAALSENEQKIVLTGLKKLAAAKKLVGDKYRLLSQEFKENIISAALLGAGESRWKKLENCENELEIKIKEEINLGKKKATGQFDDIYRAKRQEYTALLTKSEKILDKLSAPSTVKQIKSLDSAAENQNEKIAARLDILAEKIEKLKKSILS